MLRRLSLLLLSSFALPLAAATEPAQTFSYSVYTEMAAAHADAQAGHSLIDRVTAPGPRGLLIRFPRGSEARATIYLRSGPLRYVADDKDELRLPDKREWRRDNPRIELSVRPLTMGLDFGG